MFREVLIKYGIFEPSSAEKSVFLKSPPCAPIPGMRNGICPEILRIAAIFPGRVAPTTKPALP